MKTIFTTGQVANICKVSPGTVGKWFDSGQLRGYLIPGSRARRIPREYLIQFLQTNRLPLGELQDEAVHKLLLIGMNEWLQARLSEQISGEGLRLMYANDSFAAGMQAQSVHPDCVVLDFAMGCKEALTFARNLRKNARCVNTVLIGLLDDEDNANEFDRTVFHDTFRKPFDPYLLAERIRTLVGRKKQLA